ncbi:MAG: hypothetical protein PHD51_02605 [Patescibacteria group bacterium]|nr:hypothetical protein [Patescibacteria group bacterium]MDD5490251.1 hypothetical protein [Patescibacteria group bacterium]
MEEEIKKIADNQGEILRRLKKIEFCIKLAGAWAVLKIILFLIPLILAVIYLPPYIREIVSDYLNLINRMN